MDMLRRRAVMLIAMPLLGNAAIHVDTYCVLRLRLDGVGLDGSVKFAALQRNGSTIDAAPLNATNECALYTQARGAATVSLLDATQRCILAQREVCISSPLGAYDHKCFWIPCVLVLSLHLN